MLTKEYPTELLYFGGILLSSAAVVLITNQTTLTSKIYQLFSDNQKFIISLLKLIIGFYNLNVIVLFKIVYDLFC